MNETTLSLLKEAFEVISSILRQELMYLSFRQQGKRRADSYLQLLLNKIHAHISDPYVIEQATDEDIYGGYRYLQLKIIGKRFNDVENFIEDISSMFDIYKQSRIHKCSKEIDSEVQCTNGRCFRAYLKIYHRPNKIEEKEHSYTETIEALKAETRQLEETIASLYSRLAEK